VAGPVKPWDSGKEGIPCWYKYPINPIKPWARMSQPPCGLGSAGSFFFLIVCAQEMLVSSPLLDLC
jgi:hypothetical protein